jgi:hypothetical protein
MNFDHYVVWGFRTKYHTHSHIHDAIYRALKFMGKDAYWLDAATGLPELGRTFFITNHDVASQLPVRDDCFYLVHGGSDNPECRAALGHLPGYMSWNVFIDWVYAYDDSQPYGRRPINRPEAVWVGEDAPWYPSTRHMDFRWATDLNPLEVTVNKNGARALNPDSRVINYVGTYWRVNEREIADFGRACQDGGVQLRHLGAGQVEGSAYNGWDKVVSIEDNVRLVRESYFAPAIVGSHHLTEGYAPCRIFKNISYGQFGVTNSEAVQRLFGGRLICNPDPYQLFGEACERLSSVSIAELHALMDFVAEKHTYVNRLEAVFKAAELTLEG